MNFTLSFHYVYILQIKVIPGLTLTTESSSFLRVVKTTLHQNGQVKSPQKSSPVTADIVHARPYCMKCNHKMHKGCSVRPSFS